MTLNSNMNYKYLLLILNLLLINSFTQIIECDFDWNHRKSSDNNLSNQEFSQNNEENEIIVETNIRQLRPTAHTSQSNMMNTTDPNQEPEPPLIFNREDNNSPRPIILWNDKTIKLDSVSVPNRQPPFWVKVERKSTSGVIQSFISNMSEKNISPDKESTASDTMPSGLVLQPLPPSTKPVSEKQECTRLGRGKCFSFSPNNVRDCISKGGIVTMDTVRCSWVRACCVPNFFR